MSLPELPELWYFEAVATAETVGVRIVNEGTVLAERSIPCINPDDWEQHIILMAQVMWEDMNAAAKLSAHMGIPVFYE